MKIFVLEDDPERISWFKKTFDDCEISFTKDTSEARKKLKNNKYDLIFLDRDLSNPYRNGEDVAWEMARYKLAQDTTIIIHTENARGQRVMKKYLEKYHNNVHQISFIDLKHMYRIDFKKYLNP